jgi:O-Antigen ligase
MALDSRGLVTGAAIFATILLGVIMAIFVTTNAAGGIAALVPLITVILTLLALINPRAGIFGLAALVIWVDEFKRLAVYFGGAYSMTVMQTLAMPFIVLAALNAGFLLNIMFGKVKIDRLGIMIYLVGGIIGLVILKTMAGGLAERGQRAANIAGYLTLIPIACAYLKTFDEWRKFFAFQVIVALPAAAWAIKQYYFGFDQIEWEYARSGLSKVHYSQMFGFANPRVFGFFGSASALGCAAIYCAFAWWHGFRSREKRLFWFLSAILLSWVLVVSTQRAALLYPVIVLVAAFFFRTRARVVGLYSAGFILVLLGIFNATYLLNQGIENTNRFLASLGGGAWGEQVLKVSTFSDRLRGWERLARADSWSLFGTGKQTFSSVTIGFDINSSDYSHDIINKVLINYGVIGLLCIFIPGVIVLSALHSTVFVQRDKQERNDTAFAIALSLPMIFMSFLGGDNFNANPINLQIWTAFVGVLIVRQSYQRRKAEERKEKRETIVPSGPMNVPASQLR